MSHTATPVTHELKTDAEVFDAVLAGLKTYEIRKNDRGFQVGDTLILRETQFTGAEMAAGKDLIYTGRSLTVTVTHVLSGPIYGLMDGWVILNIAGASPKATAAPGTAALAVQTRERVREAISEAMGNAMDCTRIWSAWSVGTMSENDFQIVRENEDRLEEIVDAVLDAVAVQGSPAGLLSSRVRAGSEAAPWVVEAIQRLEIALSAKERPSRALGYFFRVSDDTLVQCYTPTGKRSHPDVDGNVYPQLLFSCQNPVEEGAAWPRIDHPARPTEADYEAGDLKVTLGEFGPIGLANELRLYALSQPRNGSFAGRLWAMHEYLRAVFAIEMRAHV